MGRLAPDRVIGVHVNALVTFPSGDPADMAALTEAGAYIGIWASGRRPTVDQRGCERSTVPTAVAVFTTDITVRRFADKLNNVAHWSEFGRGGHFAALEAPDLLTADIREFFRTLGH